MCGDGEWIFIWKEKKKQGCLLLIREPREELVSGATNLVLRLVEDLMRGAQSSQNVLAGVSEVDAPLQRPGFGVGHDTRTAG